MNEIERKYYKNFTIRGIIYGIIYVVVAMILQFKANTFFCGSAVTFCYVLMLYIDMKMSIKRTIKELENLKN